jgi:hypothetical protein
MGPSRQARIQLPASDSSQWEEIEAATVRKAKGAAMIHGSAKHDCNKAIVFACLLVAAP